MPLSSSLRVLCIAVLTLCFTSSALGWWEQGHMLVAQVAKLHLQQQLGNGTEVVGVVDSYVGEFSNATEYFPLSPDMVTAAVWMDDMKRYGWKAFDMWHYANTPFNPDNVSVPCLPETNVIWALNSAYSTLKSGRSGAWGRAVMTRVMLHLVGDVHQPMHTCTLFNDRFPSGDRGGNSFKLLVNGSSINLHSFWDSAAGLYETSYPRPLSPASEQGLVDEAQSLMQEHPTGSFNVSLTNADFEAWASESYGVGVSDAYLNGTLEYQAEVSLAYVANAQSISKRRIALAGYRLAHVLQTVMEPYVPPQSAACNRDSSSGDDDDDGGGGGGGDETSIGIGWVFFIAILCSACSVVSTLSCTLMIGAFIMSHRNGHSDEVASSEGYLSLGRDGSPSG